jgi:hypothetical protein
LLEMFASSSSRDMACCRKSSAVRPISGDCSHTLPRVQRSWNGNIHTFEYIVQMRSLLCSKNHRPSRQFAADTRCGYEVPGMVLLRDLKGAMRLDRSRDMSVYVSTCTGYDSSLWTPVVWELWRS